MKKLLFAVAAIAALAMLAPSSGTAEPTHPNEIGLYLTPDGLGDTGTIEVGTPVNVYLVLTKPEADNSPLSGLVAFDLQLNFSPAGNLFMTGNVLNGSGLNIGDMGNIAGGYLEFIVGFAAEVPAVDDAILLVSLQFICATANPIEVRMGPASFPTIPGEMSFVTPWQTLEVMYPISGSLDDPVFLFNGYAIAVEKESFGAVKALYR